MEIILHIGEDNVGPLSPEEVKAKHASGEVGPDTLGWMEGFETWYPLADEKFAFLGLSSPAEPEPGGEAAPVATSVEAQAVVEEAPGSVDPAVGQAPSETQGEVVPEESEEEVEPEPDPAELAATSAAYDVATAFEPRSREELNVEMMRLKQEHASVLLPEIGRKAVEEGIRIPGATETLGRIQELSKKGDSAQLKAAYVSYAQAIVSGGFSEPALNDLLMKEREVSEEMLNLHTEAKRLGNPHKPGGPLKWILIIVALLAIGGTVALVLLNQ